MIKLQDIDPTGVRDVTQELNQFFSELSPGSEVTFPEYAKYHCEGSVYIPVPGTTVNGQASMLFAETDGVPDVKGSIRGRTHLEVSGEGSRVNKLYVRGPNVNATYDVTKEAQHGYNVKGKDIVLSECHAFSVWGDGFYVGNDSLNITLQSPWVKGAGRQGIGITEVDGLTIDDMLLDNIARSAIDIEPSRISKGVSNVTITRSNILRVNFFPLTITAGAPVSNVKVKNLLVEGNMKVSVKGTGPITNITLRNVSSEEEVNETPFRFVNVDGLTVKDCRVPIVVMKGPNLPGIITTDCTNVKKVNNDFGPNGE